MTRMARVVIPFYPHHVTQRGNRRQRTFFGDADYTTYIALVSEFCRKAGARVWAMLSRVDNWEAYLSEPGDGATAEQISTHSRTGRPLGDAMFVHTLERIMGRVLTCRPPGRKRKADEI